MFETLTSLLGLTIDNEKIISFLEANGFKYPKKPFISNRSTDTSYWVENKKLGFDLLFDARTYLDAYPLVQGNKKGVFIPVLRSIRWYNNKSNTSFPQGVTFTDSFDALQTKLGAPTLKSSEISPTWLNDDGSESFYRWRLPIGKDITWGPQFNDDNEVRDISLSLKYQNPLFRFYDEMQYQALKEPTSAYDRANLHFIRWAIDRHLISGHTTAMSWLQHINRGYILENDFSAENKFIHAYINNLSSFDILYARDAETTGDDYEQVKQMIDKRLEEYNIHKFSKSLQL
jgi:hypothetical protein